MACDLPTRDNSNLGTVEMNYTDVFAQAIATLRERGEKYGNAAEMFDRTARLATIILDKEISPFEVATILKCLKDARKKNDRLNVDHYIDAINYEAFAYQFATASLDAETEDKLTAEFAKRFAPVMPDTGEFNV